MRYVAIIAALVTAGLPCLALAQAQGTTPGTAASPSVAKDSRTFELRTYYAHPGKLEELHARFRQHTVRLFESMG